MSITSKDKVALKIRLYNKTNGCCAYCGCELHNGNFQIDHIIPKRRGSNSQYHSNYNKEKGSDNENNLIACCGSCNSSKSDLDLEDFRERVLDRIKRLNDYSTEYNIAKRFGLIKELDIPIIFYFEKLT
jgi:5-methylcytosine-specific restriction endonuclease McrA